MTCEEHAFNNLIQDCIRNKDNKDHDIYEQFWKDVNACDCLPKDVATAVWYCGQYMIYVMFNGKKNLLDMVVNHKLDNLEDVPQADIDALEKQVPKKPMQDKDLFYSCPNCGAREECVRYDMLPVPDNGYKYCTNCGQKLKWESDN